MLKRQGTPFRKTGNMSCKVAGQAQERLKLKDLQVPYTIGLSRAPGIRSMSGSSSAVPQPPPAPSPGDRLDSWKEIAAYFNRDKRTVQRWERQEGMPVYRHQ